VSLWVDATGEWERHLPEMPDIYKVESTMNKFAGAFGSYSYIYIDNIYNVYIHRGTFASKPLVSFLFPRR
jgi:hypothetical protein